MIVVVKGAPRFAASQGHVDPGGVGKVDVRPAVAIVVDERHSAAHRFHYVLLRWGRQMIKLDFRRTGDVDELGNLRVGRFRDRVLSSTGMRGAENCQQEAGKSQVSQHAGSSHPHLPWADADGRYLLSSSVESPAGWSCISLKTGSSFSFISLYFLYSSTSCCESAVRPISR